MTWSVGVSNYRLAYQIIVAFTYLDLTCRIAVFVRVHGGTHGGMHGMTMVKWVGSDVAASDRRRGVQGPRTRTAVIV